MLKQEVGVVRHCGFTPARVRLAALAVLFVCLSCSGCIPSTALLEGAELTIPPDDGRGHESKDDTATLYLYRPWGFGSGLAEPLIYVNGQKVVQLQNGTRVVLTLQPGGFILQTAFSKRWIAGRVRHVWFVARAGRTYYLRVLPSTGLGTTTFNLDFLPVSVAKADLEETNFFELEPRIYPGKGHIR